MCRNRTRSTRYSGFGIQPSRSSIAFESFQRLLGRFVFSVSGVLRGGIPRALRSSGIWFELVIHRIQRKWAQFDGDIELERPRLAFSLLQTSE